MMKRNNWQRKSENLPVNLNMKKGSVQYNELVLFKGREMVFNSFEIKYFHYIQVTTQKNQKDQNCQKN